jgi:hypothetical protein
VTLRYVNGRTTYTNQSVFDVDFGNPIPWPRMRSRATGERSHADSLRRRRDGQHPGVARVASLDCDHRAVLSCATEPANPELDGAPESLTLPRTLAPRRRVVWGALHPRSTASDPPRITPCRRGGQQLSTGLNPDCRSSRSARALLRFRRSTLGLFGRVRHLRFPVSGLIVFPPTRAFARFG